MKKTKRLCQTIIDAISDGQNVSGICKKIGMARKTFYRWKEEDLSFSKRIEEAEKLRENLLNDLAISGHTRLMNTDHWPAIKYQLEKKERQSARVPKSSYREKSKEISNFFEEPKSG